MHFDLVDRVLEVGGGRIVTLKNVSASEEYLQDHFPSFPVLPGVMMLEAMVQAGRKLAEAEEGVGKVPLVLGKVRALKYGRFVKPGSALRIEVVLSKRVGDEFDFKGEGTVLEPGAVGEAPVAVSGRFILRPARVELPAIVAPRGAN
ncbi:MAG: hypothetical protein KF678_09700 [Phycisphaeraceae bacterium]|nr:hypothetical protein [Phycisphaeraceae bacterium]